MVRPDADAHDHHLVVGDITIDAACSGGGGPQVVLVHASAFQCWYRPLLDQLGDVDALTYQRSVGAAPFDLEADADAVLVAMQQAGFARAHVVGHSYGGILALELARRAPAAVASLALLEPASTGFLDAERARDVTAPLLERARADGAAAAMPQFLDLVLGEGGAERLEEHVPGGVEEATTWSEQFFRAELPALIGWHYDADDAAAVGVPVLYVAGSTTVPRFKLSRDLIREWIPAVDHVEIDGADHLVMAAHPEVVAERLRVFWAGAG